MNYFEFGESFAGQETAALRLETDHSVGNLLVTLVFQLGQHSWPEKNL